MCIQSTTIRAHTYNDPYVNGYSNTPLKGHTNIHKNAHTYTHRKIERKKELVGDFCRINEKSRKTHTS